jgi:hypothetical protein
MTSFVIFNSSLSPVALLDSFITDESVQKSNVGELPPRTLAPKITLSVEMFIEVFSPLKSKGSFNLLHLTNPLLP